MNEDQRSSRNSASKNIEVTGDQFVMGKLLSENEQDLPGMLAVAKATAEKVWPHTTDAQVWAAEFKKRFPDIDEGTMLGWFANAIMAGHDAATFARSEQLADEPVRKLNPNHPVTQVMEPEMWVKVLGMLLYRDGVKETTVPPDVVARAADDRDGLNVTIKFDDQRGIVLQLVNDKDAERIAREEGGLPV